MKDFVLHKQQMMTDNDIQINYQEDGEIQFNSTTITNNVIRQQRRNKPKDYKPLGLENRDESKIFQFDYNKGVVDWNTLDVYPYGYTK